ncbi:MAG: SbcC/MukB-like Walker B domain-containing protein, partial [Hyphomicrobium sp.]|nr:SbcC/MukB-like Walker B domain-containing protein [Hyphomicrobium sp.]
MAASARLDELRREAANRASEATVATTALLAEENRLTSARASLEAANTRLKARRRQYEEQLTGLPGPLRPANTVDAADIEAASATCAELTALSSQAQEQLTAANLEIRAISREVEQFRHERTRDIDAPVQDLRLKQATLVQVLISAAALLEVPYQQPLVGAEFALATAASEALANDQHAVQMLTAAERVSLRLQADAEAADSRMASALAAANCASLPELDQARINAAATLANARALHAEALRQQPIAQVLDQRIGDARDLYEALETIRTHFSDSKFIGFVMKNRQKILLAVGSEVLASMTSGRYGFAEDFRIVDSWSGQPRDVMTLSGGETFLASLALALGLVELAGRSGGKLDALFLDEGFGS